MLEDFFADVLSIATVNTIAEGMLTDSISYTVTHTFAPLRCGKLSEQPSNLPSLTGLAIKSGGW